MMPSPSTPAQVRERRKTAFALIALVVLVGAAVLIAGNSGRSGGAQVRLSVHVVPFAAGENYTAWIPALLQGGSAAWIVDQAGRNFNSPPMSVATNASGTWINLSATQSVTFFAWTSFERGRDMSDMHWSALEISEGGAQHLRFSASTEHGDPVGVSVWAQYDDPSGTCNERVAASDMIPGDGKALRVLLEVHDPC